MFLICWGYVSLTLFEPVHPNDDHMQRWDDEFRSLFAVELTIMCLFALDFVMSFYHNSFETLFKEYKLQNTTSQISENKPPSSEDHVNVKNLPRRTTLVIGRQEPNELTPPITPQNNVKKPPAPVLGRHNFNKWKLFFLTFLEQDLRYKLLIFLVFFVDFCMFYSMYPHNVFRFSRFARTIPFAIYSKATKRTLQAVYHSVKRILDFFIFFFSIVLLYAILGYKIFYDDSRTYYTSAWYDEHINDFNSYGIIVNSLIVLVTFDNYPFVMRPFIEQSMWYLCYFIPYILLNILFFIPVPIAVVYDGFRVGLVEFRKNEAS